MTYEEYQKHHMQQEELNGFIKGMGIIICQTAQQRNDVLRYLMYAGFELTETAKLHVRHNELCGNFLNPGFDRGGHAIDCYSVRIVENGINRPTIRFSQISHLIYGLPDQTKEEFDAAFAAFFSGEEVPA